MSETGAYFHVGLTSNDFLYEVKTQNDIFGRMVKLKEIRSHSCSTLEVQDRMEWVMEPQ